MNKFLDESGLAYLWEKIKSKISALDANSVNAANKDLSNLTDYQRALHNIGGRPNRSLVINGVFHNPVNQQGKNEYRNPVGSGAMITLDRWIAESGVNVFYNNGHYLGITRESGTANALIQVVTEETAQRLVGKSITVSILTQSGDLAFATGVVNLLTENTLITASINNISFGVAFFAESRSYQIGRFATDGGDIAAVKVEPGNIQTLAYKDSNGAWQLFEAPDYGEELARCQPYQLALRQYFIAPAVHFATDYIDFLIPTPVEMRTVPIINSEGVAIISDSKGEQTGFSISVVAKSSNAIRVRATKTGHGLSLLDGIRLEVLADRAMIDANL